MSNISTLVKDSNAHRYQIAGAPLTPCDEESQPQIHHLLFFYSIDSMTNHEYCEYGSPVEDYNVKQLRLVIYELYKQRISSTVDGNVHKWPPLSSRIAVTPQPVGDVDCGLRCLWHTCVILSCSREAWLSPTLLVEIFTVKARHYSYKWFCADMVCLIDVLINAAADGLHQFHSDLLRNHQDFFHCFLGAFLSRNLYLIMPSQKELSTFIGLFLSSYHSDTMIPEWKKTLLSYLDLDRLAMDLLR